MYCNDAMWHDIVDRVFAKKMLAYEGDVMQKLPSKKVFIRQPMICQERINLNLAMSVLNFMWLRLA